MIGIKLEAGVNKPSKPLHLRRLLLKLGMVAAALLIAAVLAQVTLPVSAMLPSGQTEHSSAPHHRLRF